MRNGVIARKLQTVDEVLNELRSLGQVDADTLKRDWLVQRYDHVEVAILVDVVNNRLAAFVSLTAREYEDEMAQWQRALRCSLLNSMRPSQTSRWSAYRFPRCVVSRDLLE